MCIGLLNGIGCRGSVRAEGRQQQNGRVTCCCHGKPTLAERHARGVCVDCVLILSRHRVVPFNAFICLELSYIAASILSSSFEIAHSSEAIRRHRS